MRRRGIVAALACSLLASVALPAGAVAPSNGRIWFLRTPASSFHAERVVSTEVDGSDRQQAFKHDDPTIWNRLVLSPDGTRIAFQDETNAGSRLVIVDAADGGNRTVVFPRANVYYSSIAWYPDGSRLLFTRADFDADDARYLLYSSALDGSDVVAIGTGRKYDASMSPDMLRIVYRDGRNRLGIVDTDGTDQHLILDDERNYDPVWSPDGARIAFVREVPGGADIFTISPEGMGLERVLMTAKWEYDPIWSPDSSRLLFQRVLDRAYTRADLWTVGQDGSAVERVTNDADFEWPVGWAPA
jgi:Tol biopolymer transport system component